MNIKEFKAELRRHDIAGDPWGTAMGAWFDCAAHLYEKGDCPPEWRYRPGTMGNTIDKDGPFYQEFEAATAEQLEAIGRLLYRYSEFLRFHGKDY